MYGLTPITFKLNYFDFDRLLATGLVYALTLVIGEIPGRYHTCINFGKPQKASVVKSKKTGSWLWRNQSPLSVRVRISSLLISSERIGGSRSVIMVLVYGFMLGRLKSRIIDRSPSSVWIHLLLSSHKQSLTSPPTVSKGLDYFPLCHWAMAPGSDS